jgi:hypothetical protein
MNFVKKIGYIYNKMRLVRETIGFTRGQDPKDAMNTGLQKSIENWLNSMGIYKYKLSGKEMLISVLDQVELSGKFKTRLPDFISFENIEGGFYCSHNKLVSLKGMPQHINAGFVCNDNLLPNLEYGPKVVDGFYVVDNNKLTSLIGLPEAINTLAINDNLLTSLKGCPKIINGDLFCYNNNLKNLDYFPEKIMGSLFISFTEEFKQKHNIRDPKHYKGHVFIEEIENQCVVEENIKII